MKRKSLQTVILAMYKIKMLRGFCHQMAQGTRQVGKPHKRVYIEQKQLIKTKAKTKYNNVRWMTAVGRERVSTWASLRAQVSFIS